MISSCSDVGKRNRWWEKPHPRIIGRRRIESWQPLNLVSARQRESQMRSNGPERKSNNKAAVFDSTVNAS
jgi:hypothetical protein